VFILDCTLEDNSAGEGGAIFGVESLIVVINSTFVGNEALAAGGAIFNEGAEISVTNSTFSGNQTSPGNGGAIATDIGVSFANNSIFANNLGGNCAGLGDSGYNISDDNTCGFSGTSLNNSTTLNLDPLGLQNNGGPTQTIALEPNSQAVDFIPIAGCTSLVPTPVTTDQRNFPRPDSGNLNFCDAGAFELQTGRITVLPGSEKTQIARPTTSSDSDQVNMAFTFLDRGSPVLDDTAPIPLRCDAGNDALNGINVDLFEGTCADLATATGGLLLHLSPFVKHTISGHSYGTIFQSDPPDMLQQTAETVLARIVPSETPWEEVCGEWTINIEVAGLDTATLGLGDSNPFALVVEDGDKNEGCFDITNAVVGPQIPPPTRKVRRGVRRGRR
jgi:polymorphic membrane protein